MLLIRAALDEHDSASTDDGMPADWEWPIAAFVTKANDTITATLMREIIAFIVILSLQYWHAGWNADQVVMSRDEAKVMPGCHSSLLASPCLP